MRDRRDGAFCLGPTHEEAFTELVASTVVSWRQLEGGGLRLYQTDRKYRDEVRPRFGLMRGREFVMKDMYSFDADVDAARAAYDEVSASYAAIFRAIFGNEGTGWSRVEADTGNIGGSLSHEYQVHADVGEDLVLHCPRCNHAANQEKMAAPLHNSVMQDNNNTTSDARHQDAVQSESRPRREVVFRATSSNADAGADAAPFSIVVRGLPTGRQANALKIRAHLELEEEPTLVTRDVRRAVRVTVPEFDGQRRVRLAAVAHLAVPGRAEAIDAARSRACEGVRHAGGDRLLHGVSASGVCWKRGDRLRFGSG